MGGYKMHIKKIYYIGLLIFCLTQSFLNAASWRVLFYMDSSDNLSDMAFKSITEMMDAQLDHTVECFIQLHAYHNIALRYKIKNNNLQFLERISLSGDSKQDFINAATWGFNNNNADHTMLILSNHGWGILDPRWNEAAQKWVIDHDVTANCCAIKRSRLMDHQHNHRGFMFNEGSHTYLTNSNLVAGLYHIKNQLLHSNIDIVAFDTCMGAMMEVGYQIAPFANFMIGCQSCALKAGFDYTGIMQSLKNEFNDPRTVAIGMVKAFDAYYNVHDDKGIYTNSVFDLSLIHEVCTAMDITITSLLNIPNALEILENARNHTPRLCMWPMYTDMIEFFLLCQKHMPNNTEFNAALFQLQDLHNRMIIAYCCGFDVKNFVHGSAIYCPFIHIEKSYHDTIFAQSCQWMNVLRLICEGCTQSCNMQEWSVGNN